MKKFIITFVIVIIVLLFGGLVAVAASGLVHVPVLTKLLKADQPKDLGVTISEQLFTDMLRQAGINLVGSYADFCLTCQIMYANPKPVELSVTSDELSSYLQSTNNVLGPLEHIQVRLLDDNTAEMSAFIDLTEYGIDMAAPVYVTGAINTDGSTIDFDISSAKVGALPVTQNYIEQGETELEQLVNSHLEAMPGLTIDTLEINNGTLEYAGIFPTTITAGTK